MLNMKPKKLKELITLACSLLASVVDGVENKLIESLLTIKFNSLSLKTLCLALADITDRIVSWMYSLPLSAFTFIKPKNLTLKVSPNCILLTCSFDSLIKHWASADTSL